LRQIYKEPILIKLGLGRKFPRTVLYSRKSALGVGLMTPSTIIACLKLKLYVGNKQKLGNTEDSIAIQEAYQEVEAGRRMSLGEDPKFRYWNKTWVDEINDELWKRKMVLKSSLKEREKGRTSNKSLMEYALEYVEVRNRKRAELRQINYVRLKKGILLPCEVVGSAGKMQTSYYRNIFEMSLINWKFDKILNEQITRGQKTIWEKFLKWLRVQEVNTIWDFDAEWHWKISSDREIVQIEQENEKKTYKRINESRNIYKRDESYEIEEDTRGCIERINIDGSVSIYDVQNKSNEKDQEIEENLSEYSETMLEHIRNGVAIAATDAAMEGNYIATQWIISTKNNEEEIEIRRAHV